MTHDSIGGTNLFAGTNGGIFLSTDNGDSWSQIFAILSDDIYFISFLVRGSTLFAGTNNGVYLSTNNGSSWTRCGLMGTSVPSL